MAILISLLSLSSSKRIIEFQGYDDAIHRSVSAGTINYCAINLGILSTYWTGRAGNFFPVLLGVPSRIGDFSGLL
jgi:hypothetical protein